MGGTSSWRVCGLTPATSLAVVFEVANQVRGRENGGGGLDSYTVYLVISCNTLLLCWKVYVSNVWNQFIDGLK